MVGLCKEFRHFSAQSAAKIQKNVTDFTLILNVLKHLADSASV